MEDFKSGAVEGVGMILRGSDEAGEVSFVVGWRRGDKLKVIQFASLVPGLPAVVTQLPD